MAIAFVNHVEEALGQNGGTTSAIDMTGANFIWIAVVRDTGTSITLSDSSSNSYTALDDPETKIKFFYKAGATVSNSMTFTVSGTNIYAAITVLGFSGVHSSPLDQSNTATGGFGQSFQPGSVTPSEDNEVLCTAVYFNANHGTVTINSSFTPSPAYTVAFSSGVNYGIAAAYQIQTTATTRNPTFSWTSDAGCTAGIYTFKETVAGTLGRLILSSPQS